MIIHIVTSFFAVQIDDLLIYSLAFYIECIKLLKGKVNTHNNIKRGTCLKFAIDTLLSWLSNMFLRKMKNNCNQGGCFYSTFPTALLWLVYQVKLLY